MALTLLHTDEAAARLGVKRETLYAYVSRGLLSRVPATDGRSSLFDPDEIDAFRAERRRSASGELNTVIASAITRLDERGHRYRNTSVLRLVRDRARFERVCDLLWQEEHNAATWRLPPQLRREIATAISAMPEAMAPLDRLRVALAVVSSHVGTQPRHTSETFAEVGRYALLAMCFALGSRSAKQLSLAERLWPGLSHGNKSERAKASPSRLRCLEAAMILLADHGLATSTFAVRVTASVRADPCSAVASGLGAMAGLLHGCAADGAVELFEAAHTRGVEVSINSSLDAGERIAGFGHKVYRQRDPREHCLLRLVYEAWPNDERVATIRSVRAHARRRTARVANIDFALGAMAWLGGFRDSGTSIFAIARTAGWIAHASEELGEEPVRFRPRARYVAP